MADLVILIRLLIFELFNFRRQLRLEKEDDSMEIFEIGSMSNRGKYRANAEGTLSYPECGVLNIYVCPF